jgi:hypothetical protein
MDQLATRVERTPPPQHEPPPLTTALERVVEAVQRVVADQLKLARAEAGTTARRTMIAAGFVAGAGLLGLVAWIGFCAAAWRGLAEAMHPAAAFAVVAGVNLLIGAGLGIVGVRKLTGEEEGAHDGAS